MYSNIIALLFRDKEEGHYVADAMIKILIKVILVVFSLSTSSHACLEHVGKKGEEVRILVCGEVESPKQITLYSGTGARGALLMAGGITKYGTGKSVKLYRLGKLHRLDLESDTPDIKLENNDVIEVPRRAIYEDMAKDRILMIIGKKNKKSISKILTDAKIVGDLRSWKHQKKSYRELRRCGQNT